MSLLCVLSAAPRTPAQVRPLARCLLSMRPCADALLLLCDLPDAFSEVMPEVCNPGMDAIIAALNPNSSDYYFFCHDSKGQAYYASTLEQQNANLEYIESYDN